MIAYGLAAGLSVLAVLVTLVILTSGNPVANGWRFFGGFLLTVLVVGGVIVFLSSAFAPDDREPVLMTLLKLALGVLLLAAAWHERPGRDKGEGSGGKLKAFLATLEGLTPKGAFTTGMLLAVAPKRLAITVLAALTIGMAALTTGQSVALLVVYTAIVSAPIWLLLSGYVLGGKRSDRFAAEARSWIIANAHPVVFVVSLAFGLLFTLQAVAELLT